MTLTNLATTQITQAYRHRSIACTRALATSRSQVPTRAFAVSRSTFSPSRLSWLASGTLVLARYGRHSRGMKPLVVREVEELWFGVYMAQGCSRPSSPHTGQATPSRGPIIAHSLYFPCCSGNLTRRAVRIRHDIVHRPVALFDLQHEGLRFGKLFARFDG